ncbi:Basal-body rod modification protein FlgD [Burkholderiales bacterium 8X]|nr:Basal-body rod modification protein FlgD [Burkholderiales bacterium 8X]
MTTTAATNSLATPGYTYSPTSATDSNSVTTTNAAQAQDRFLKLLVAQMNNQDPMNPMDNAQMTSQIAQINTVTGIQGLNDTMKNMATQMSAMQVLQAGNLVGHGVLAEGNQLAFDTEAQTAVGAVQLDAAATDVKIQVSTAGGQVIDTVSLGKLAAGQHGFSLDSSKYPADTPLKFTVVAKNGADPVAATPLMRDKVVAVGSGADGALSLTLLNGGSTPYSSVRAVL